LKTERDKRGLIPRKPLLITILYFVYGMIFCSFSIRLDLAVRWGLFYFTLPRLLPFLVSEMWGGFSLGHTKASTQGC